jgi:hypothetical protein
MLIMRTTWRFTSAKLPVDMMGCPDLLITIGAAVRDSYVVLKDSRSVLLVSHRTWSSVENQAASSSRSPNQNCETERGKRHVYRMGGFVCPKQSGLHTYAGARGCCMIESSACKDSKDASPLRSVVSTERKRFQSACEFLFDPPSPSPKSVLSYPNQPRIYADFTRDDMSSPRL